MEGQSGENGTELENQQIDNPETLCILLKDLLNKAFEASYFAESSNERRDLERNINIMLARINEYFQANAADFSKREHEFFTQFLRLPMTRIEYFILRGIELLGSVEFRLKPANFSVRQHRDIYKKFLLPSLISLIEDFIQDAKPDLGKLITIGELSSAIIASEIYDNGTAFYEMPVFELHSAFREAIKKIVEYKTDLGNNIVPVMSQCKFLLESVLQKLS